MTLCVSGIVRAVHQSSSKLGDTPLVRLDLFESLPSRRFGCRASTTNSTAKSRSTSLYNGGASSRGGCRALQLYSSTALYTLHPLHPPSGEQEPRSNFLFALRRAHLSFCPSLRCSGFSGRCRWRCVCVFLSVIPSGWQTADWRHRSLIGPALPYCHFT